MTDTARPLWVGGRAVGMLGEPGSQRRPGFSLLCNWDAPSERA